MKIGVVGTGYVGLVQGVILSEFGLEVTCVDTNIEKIEMLKNGGVPIYEPGLEPLLKKNIEAGRLQFTSEIKEAVETSEVLFIAVGTPPADDGSADLRYVLEVANSIGEHMNGYRVVVDKSTVPVGTGKLVKETIQKKLDERGVDFEFDVVSNPEFLREGKAVNDCLRPDRVVIGYSDERAKEMMKKVYNVLYINETPFVFTSVETAEMIKYASNAFLAVKISFINEMALLAEKVGADVQQIAKAMGQDGRISPKFLHAGPGYGGSCFPKDTKALAHTAHQLKVPSRIVEAVIQSNDQRKLHMASRIIEAVGGSGQGKTIGILGLTFKPNTDDMRDAPSLTVIPELQRLGLKIKAYDPVGMDHAKHLFSDVEFCASSTETVTDCDAIVILTEWNEFRALDLNFLKSIVKSPVLVDLRNIYKPDEIIAAGFDYISIGRPTYIQPK